MGVFHRLFVTVGSQAVPMLRPVLALSLLLSFTLLLSACGAMDYVPWPASGGGGRPASMRRPAPGRQTPAVATAPAPREALGPAVFSALRGQDAERMAQRLSPASQSLESFADLNTALRHSLEHAARMPQRQPALVRPGGSLSWGQFRQTLEELLTVLPRLDAEPALLSERFVWYELSPQPLLTGYYAPEMEASPVRTAGFEYPLYAPPADLKRAGGQAYERRRVDIDGALAGRGLELAWLSNPADPFLLQTEGGGVLRYPDGSRRGVHFAATNGLDFKGLGAILLERGALPKERLARESIRQWCAENPKRAQELMADNPSYVFFRYTSAVGEGSLGKPLTPLVSLATDPSLLPLGAVLALDVPVPTAYGSLRGLALAQDTGADIRGLRLDLFLGSGERAERMESGLRAPASLYLLVSKSALRAKAN